jgi:hypothetical protein
MKESLKNLALIFLFSLFLREVSSLAVAQPMPSNVTLRRGESLPFKFEIQAITSREDQLCTYSIGGLKPLTVKFEKEEALVKAGSFLDVFGTLEVPRNAPLKEYEGKLTVSCRPIVEAKGVSVIVQTTELPFRVKVVGSEGKERKVPAEFFLVLAGTLFLCFLLKRKIERGKGKRKGRK